MPISCEAIGLAFGALTGSVSFFSVLVLLAIIGVKYRRKPPGQRILFRTNLDICMFNLLISELLMSLGGVLDAKWANETQVYCGGYCNAQGSLQYLGETSVALWTLAVTFLTGWNVLTAQKVPYNAGVCVVIMGGVWGFVFAFNFAMFASYPRGEFDTDSYFTPTPFWCWINSKYYNERLAGELWLAGFGNLLVYIPLFLLLRGNIVLGDEGLASHKWYWIPPPHNNPDEETARKEATKLLYYPLAYTIVISPLSIVRWITFTNVHLGAVQKPENAKIATAILLFHCVFRLSGAVNVCLFATTRPNVLLFGEDQEADDEVEDNRGIPLGRLGGSGSDGSLRHRNNSSDGNRQNGGTGFGGPIVDPHRHRDGERVLGKR